MAEVRKIVKNATFLPSSVARKMCQKIFHNGGGQKNKLKTTRWKRFCEKFVIFFEEKETVTAGKCVWEGEGEGERERVRVGRKQGIKEQCLVPGRKVVKEKIQK